mmetsp:Transcript_20358/g.51659  ORF Transcript_20358/g.51659 Transcript_20358/m.51659 type:complete len:212 (-) Transcript_20358:878-1513(-)
MRIQRAGWLHWKAPEPSLAPKCTVPRHGGLKASLQAAGTRSDEVVVTIPAAALAWPAAGPGAFADRPGPSPDPDPALAPSPFAASFSCHHQPRRPPRGFPLRRRRHHCRPCLSPCLCLGPLFLPPCCCRWALLSHSAHRLGCHLCRLGCHPACRLSFPCPWRRTCWQAAAHLPTPRTPPNRRRAQTLPPRPPEIPPCLPRRSWAAGWHGPP